MLHDYQRKRILTLLDPTQDPLGAGYHIIQSTIAVGSGGISGKGWLNGTQAHSNSSRASHRLHLCGVLRGIRAHRQRRAARALRAAHRARPDDRRQCGDRVRPAPRRGHRPDVLHYAFVNMGMVSGILPVVGVPLPFLSYGGTALLTLFIGAGILMSVQRHRKLVQT